MRHAGLHRCAQVVGQRKERAVSPVFDATSLFGVHAVLHGALRRVSVHHGRPTGDEQLAPGSQNSSNVIATSLIPRVFDCLRNVVIDAFHSHRVTVAQDSLAIAVGRWLKAESGNASAHAPRPSPHASDGGESDWAG